MMFESLNSNPERFLPRRHFFILVFPVLFALAIYLGLSLTTYRAGFPLDDAWIHQTYARNLARLGEWSFVPGDSSGGSTAPLWTLLLAVGFWSGLAPYWGTYLLGGLCLWGIACLSEIMIRRMTPSYAPNFPWAGCLMALEWHLVWAAFSGMETILLILFILVVMNLLLSASRQYLLAGILVGISIWVRPDGVTLLGPFMLAPLLLDTRLVALKRIQKVFLGFGVFFVFYLLFNLITSGMPMPTTFYAKQVEYAGWQATPIGERLLYFALQFFQGVTIILIPGFIQKIISEIRRRNWPLICFAIWMVGYILMYLLRLPVYQHGRYYLPAMGVYLLIGFSGFWEMLSALRKPRWQRVYTAVVTAVLAVSFVFGASAYAGDVAYIEMQMVDTARWLAGNVPADAKIAAHDIGALGYFCQNEIVDLAGLITPEVVPIINDDQLLRVYMQNHAVQYLVAFPGWKPSLIAGQQLVFVSNTREPIPGNLGNMGVYRLNRP